MAELGTGYISIVPEVSKISPGIAAALKGAEPEADKSGKTMGQKITSGLGTTLKAGVVGVGVAAGAGLGVSLTKGLGRLTGIENAEAKLAGLGHSASGVSAVMTDALSAVKGTAFGLEDAATIAASAVAAGIQPGQELAGYLTLVGDVASITGRSMSDMGRVMNNARTVGAAYNDTLQVLAESGLPVYQLLSEEMGVSAAEVKKLASEGKVSAEILEEALRTKIGGAALSSGDTVQGAFANMGAAAGRLGATLSGPFFRQASSGFGAVTSGLDALNGAAGPVMQDLEQWIVGSAVPGFQKLAASAKQGWDSFRGSAEVQSLLAQTGLVFSDLVGTAGQLGPVLGGVGSALGQASAALGVSGWQLFLTTLSGVSTVAKAVTPPLEAISGFMADHPGLVTAAVAAWVGFKTVPGILDAITPAVTKLSGAATTGGTSVLDFGSAIGEAYGYARQANPEMGRFGTAMKVLGGEGGVAAAGIEKLSSAASGVMGAFGGPWGIALTAATALVAGLMSAHQKADAAQRETAMSARDAAEAQLILQQAVAGTTDGLSEEGLAAAARVATGELAGFVNQGEALSGWMYKVETDASWWERVLGTEEWQSARESARTTRAAYKELETATEELGIPMEELSRVVAEGGPEYDALIVSLRGAGDAGNHAADQLEGTRATLDRMIADARRLDPAVAQAAEAIDVLADASSTADDKLSALQRILQAMGLAPKDAELAMRDAAAAVDEIVEAATNTEVPLENMGQGLMDAAAAGDWSHTGWRDLSQVLQGMSEELQNVAVNGGDVAAAYEGQGPALEALAAQYGLTREQIDQLARSMGLVPDEIAVAVSMAGLEEAGQELAAVWTQLEDMPVGKTVEFSAMTDEARDALSEIGFQIEEIPGSDNVEITATTEEARARLDEVFQQMQTMDGLSVEPTVLLNTTPLKMSKAEADGVLAALNIQTPTPEADLIIEKLLGGVAISQGELDYLASQTPTPVADLERSLLEQGVQVSDSMLTALHERKPKPILDANGQPLRTAVDSSKLKLEELKDKTVTIRIQEWREYYSSGRGTSSAGTAVGQHYGQTGGRFDPMSGFAQLPGHADGARHAGYQLPGSGPGTSVTDGFLAVDHQGMPIARLDANEWVINGESSEKYSRALSLINRDDPSVRHLAAYQDGGRVGRPAEEIFRFARGEMVDGHQASRSLEGAVYEFSGINWGDCSAAVSALSRFAVGLAPMAARFATGNQREALSSMGFSSGLGGPTDFNVGWFNGGPYGGHTSATIAGVNMEMGGGRGNGQIGGSAAPATHSQYTDHAHLKLASPVPVRAAEAPTEWAETASDPGDQWVDPAQDPTEAVPASPGGGSAPTSWSQVAGIAASAFAEGMVSDALGVFGIPDAMPPAVQAWNQWQDVAPEAMPKIQEQAQNTFAAAMQAVVGDRVWPLTPPAAVTDLMRQLKIPGFRDGGLFRGPGGPRDDKAPALLSDGEFIVNEEATSRNRGLLEEINAGGSPRGETHYHMHGGDTGDLLRQLEARELAISMRHLGG